MQLVWIVALMGLNGWLLSRILWVGKAELTTVEQWRRLFKDES